MEKESAPENKFCDKIWALKPFRYNIIQTPLNKSAKQIGSPISIPPIRAAAWQETLEETGVNPFQTDLSSTLTQLSVEQDFQTGGNDNIFGETKESCLAAINKILERIENPLAAVTDERAAYLQQEKEFYTVLASKIRE